MKKVNAMVLAVDHPKVASPDGKQYWEVKVGYSVACPGIVFKDLPVAKGTVIKEGKVTWCKPADDMPNKWVVGFMSATRKLLKRKTVFMTQYPELGQWMEVCLL